MSNKIINPKLHFYILMSVALSIFFFMTTEYARFFQPHLLNLVIAFIIGIVVGSFCFLFGIWSVKTQNESIYVASSSAQKGLNPLWIIATIILTVVVACVAAFTSIYLLLSWFWR